MRNFVIWVLVVLISLTGLVCTVYLILIKGFGWYHIPLLIGAAILIVPAMLWWEEFITKVFSETKDSLE